MIANLDDKNQLFTSYSEIMEKISVSKPTLIKLFKDLSAKNILNKTKDTVNKINLKSNDEIGQMATVVNKNIEDIESHINEDNCLIDNVKEVVNDVSSGHLEKRIQVTCSTTSLNELRNLINKMLNNFVIPQF